MLGEWAFYGLKLKVTPDVLIPRPETELLVERAVAWLETHPDKVLAADVGTGSGCIGVILAKYFAKLHIFAIDVSVKALKIAVQNAALHHVERQINFIHGSLLEKLAQPVDLICANLPYIPSQTLKNLDVYQREPTLALDGGEDGLDLIGELLRQAVTKILPGGMILLEIEAGQGQAVAELAKSAFPGARVRVEKDLAGHDRLVVIEVSG